MDIKKLEDTISMMHSNDYKERFKAEYYQLKIRLDNLNKMLEKWDKGKLNFTPTCQRELYTRQVKVMNDYLKVLETRSYIEGVDI